MILNVGKAKQADGININRSAGSTDGYIVLCGGMLDMKSGRE